MGKKNRKRRGANGRRQHHSEQAFVTATERFVAAVRSRDWAAVRGAVDVLATEPASGVAAEIGAVIERQIAVLWRNGWQPADLVRSVDRDLGKSECALVRWAMASEAATYEELGARVAPDWMAQLRRVDAMRTWNRSSLYETVYHVLVVVGRAGNQSGTEARKQILALSRWRWRQARFAQRYFRHTVIPLQTNTG
jgi:hypothetical protein